MKRLLLAAGMFVLAHATVQAQTGTARGRVLDDKGQPVAEAVVTIEFLGSVPRKLQGKTNKDGLYFQVGLQTGNYRFTANKEGYQGGYVEARVSVAEPADLPDIKLTPRAAAAGPDKAMTELKAVVDKAIELAGVGKLAEAEALYQEAIAKNPQLALLHYNLAIVQTLRKDNVAAEASYRKALELRPDYTEAVAGLSNFYLSGNQAGKAADLVEKAVSASPENARLQYQLGYVYFNTSRADDAVAALQKAEALDASNAEIQYYLGNSLLQQGKVAECVARLEKYLAMSPQNPTNVAAAKGLIQALKK